MTLFRILSHSAWSTYVVRRLHSKDVNATFKNRIPFVWMNLMNHKVENFIQSLYRVISKSTEHLARIINLVPFSRTTVAKWTSKYSVNIERY